jgi:hypothetical protein
MSVQSTGTAGGALDRPNAGTIADVIDTILDKGLVIDAFVRVSLVGIELLTVDARIVVASVDTYLRFAEAANRLDLEQNRQKGLPDLIEGMEEGGAKSKTKGALEAAEDKIGELLHGDEEDDEEYEEEEEPRSSGKRRR